MKEQPTTPQASTHPVRILTLADEQGKIRFRLAITDILFLLSLIGISILSSIQHRKRPVLRLSSGLFIPKNLPTGDTLDDLQARFQEAVDSFLLGNRLAYLYAVLFDPDLILSYVKQPWLADQVEADNLASNTALFLCIAAIEEEIEVRTFSNNPANTMAAYLRSEFKKRDWMWPHSPLAWKQHFLHHYVDTLFRPGAPLKG